MKWWQKRMPRGAQRSIFLEIDSPGDYSEERSVMAAIAKAKSLCRGARLGGRDPKFRAGRIHDYAKVTATQYDRETGAGHRSMTFKCKARAR